MEELSPLLPEENRATVGRRGPRGDSKGHWQLEKQEKGRHWVEMGRHETGLQEGGTSGLCGLNFSRCPRAARKGRQVGEEAGPTVHQSIPIRVLYDVLCYLNFYHSSVVTGLIL